MGLSAASCNCCCFILAESCESEALRNLSMLNLRCFCVSACTGGDVERSSGSNPLLCRRLRSSPSPDVDGLFWLTVSPFSPLAASEVSSRMMGGITARSARLASSTSDLRAGAGVMSLVLLSKKTVWRLMSDSLALTPRRRRKGILCKEEPPATANSGGLVSGRGARGRRARDGDGKGSAESGSGNCFAWTQVVECRQPIVSATQSPRAGGRRGRTGSGWE